MQTEEEPRVACKHKVALLLWRIGQLAQHAAPPVLAPTAPPGQEAPAPAAPAASALPAAAAVPAAAAAEEEVPYVKKARVKPGSFVAALKAEDKAAGKRPKAEPQADAEKPPAKKARMPPAANPSLAAAEARLDKLRKEALHMPPPAPKPPRRLQAP